MSTPPLALRRLPGTPALINEAGAFVIGETAAPVASTTPALPLGAKRLMGTPCFVSADGKILDGVYADQHPGLQYPFVSSDMYTKPDSSAGSAPSQSPLLYTSTMGRPGLKRLIGTPCFVTEGGDIVDSDGKQAPQTQSRSPPAVTTAKLHRILGTPCFVDDNGNFVDVEATPKPTVTSPTTSQTVPTVTFTGFPGDSFRFSVHTDKLETVVTLHSTKQHEKWQCRIDDTTMKGGAPDGVQLPRSAIAQLLTDALEVRSKNGSGSHSVDLARSADSTTAATLTLTLGLGGGFRPVYKFELKQVPVPEQEASQGQIADLKNQVEELKHVVRHLETQLSQQTNAIYFP